MRVYYCSDLHLEHIRHEWFLPQVENEKESVLVLAGDITIAMYIDKHYNFFENIFERFGTILYVLGNHEFYNGQWEASVKDIRNFMFRDFPTIHVLENASHTVEDVTFYGCTLWTNIYEYDEGYAKSTINDYHSIKHSNGKYKLSPSMSTERHKESVKWLMKNVDAKKSVIVTHHAPSFQSVSRQFIGNRLNCCFATSLDDMVDLLGAEYYIHGHMHNKSNYMIGETNILVNPKGYPGENGPAEEFTLEYFEV